MIWNGVDVGAILTLILQTVLAAGIPLAVAWLFTEGRKGIAAFEADVWAKLDDRQRAAISSIVTTAVHMAEQIAARDDVKGFITDKKALAEQYVNSQLAKFGITLTAQEIEAEIEAAVSQQFNQPPKTVEVAPTPAPAPAPAQGAAAENTKPLGAPIGG